MQLLDKQDDAYTFYEKELVRLLGTDKGKPVIGLSAWMYFPYANDIKVSVALHKKGEASPTFVKVQAARPLPNKNIVVAQGRFGRRLSRSFLPIVFEDMEQLRKTEKITIVWVVGDYQEITICEYDLSFKDPVQIAAYGLRTYEKTIVNTLSAMEESAEEDAHCRESLDTTRLIAGTSMYDDMYIIENQDGQMRLMAEFHAKDSTHCIEAFCDEEAMLPYGLISVLLGIGEKELKAAEKGDKPVTPIAFYHSVLELDDERIIHL